MRMTRNRQTVGRDPACHARDANASRRFLIAALLLAAATIAPYLQTRHHAFILYDDDGYVTANADVRHGLSAHGVAWAFDPGGHFANWHPLTWLSLMTDVSLFGPNPGPMHLVNALLHAGAAVALLALLFGLTRHLGVAWVAAACWALHPLRVESVAWISQRKEVLSTLLGLLALLAYLEGIWRRRQAGWDGIPAVHVPAATVAEDRDGSQPWVLLATVLFALAFMAKPTVMTLPLLAAALEYLVLGRVRWRNIEVMGWLALAGMLITLYAQGLGGAMNPDFPPWQRLLNATASLGIYVRQTFIPIHLAIPYPLRPPRVSAVLAGLVMATLLATVIWTTAWLRRGRPAAAGGDDLDAAARRPYGVGVAWFVIALAPMIGLVQVGEQAHADRYTHWPSIGLALALAWALRRGQPRHAHSAAIFWAGASIVLAALAVATNRQVARWRNTETLFTWTATVTERNYDALYNLGTYLCFDGRPEEGVHYLRLAAACRPNHYESLANLTWALALAGNADEAHPLAVRIDEMRPGNGSARLALAILARQRHAPMDAERMLRVVLRALPGSATSWWEFGLDFADQNRWPEAMAAWRRALDLNPLLTQVATLIQAHVGRIAGAPAVTWESLLADPPGVAGERPGSIPGLPASERY